MESPEYIRISTAAAIVLGLKRGRFYRNATTHCINLLQTYKDGCKANCQYCGQARDFANNSNCERLIRVGWPLFRLDKIVSRIKITKKEVQRICVAMISNPKAGNDLITIIGRLKSELKIPMSVLVTPTNLSKSHFRKLYDLQIDNITIALDTATEPLFEKLRGNSVSSPHKYENYLDKLRKAVQIFGKRKVGVHLIVGLGESEFEMLNTIDFLHKLDIDIHLFSFYPEAGSPLEKLTPPHIGRYRRIQLARYLITNDIVTIKDFKFNNSEQIIDFGIPKDKLDQYVNLGLPFETSGCTGCNRPYANCRPSEIIRNFPFKPSMEDLKLISSQLTNYNTKGVKTQ